MEDVSEEVDIRSDCLGPHEVMDLEGYSGLKAAGDIVLELSLEVGKILDSDPQIWMF